jgi:hypothetical protein
VWYLLTGTKFRCGYSFTNEAFTDDHGHPIFFRTHEIKLVGISDPALRRYGKEDIIDSFKREITKAKEAFHSTYDRNYIPIELLQGARWVLMPLNKGALGAGSHIILTSPVEGVKIGYTLDGSELDQNSSIYREPILLSTVLGKQLRTNFLGDERGLKLLRTVLKYVIISIGLAIFLGIPEIAQEQIRFQHLFKMGAYNNSIIQDRDGFVWVGCTNDIVRYDGYETRAFKSGKGLLSSSIAPGIFEDDEGLLWISTSAGLNVYNKRTNSFTYYIHDLNSLNSDHFN